jgi:hypothetical protein
VRARENFRPNAFRCAACEHAHKGTSIKVTAVVENQVKHGLSTLSTIILTFPPVPRQKQQPLLEDSEYRHLPMSADTSAHRNYSYISDRRFFVFEDGLSEVFESYTNKNFRN